MKNVRMKFSGTAVLFPALLCIAGGMILFASCSGKENSPADTLSPGTIKAFTGAGIAPLRQKVSPRDFSLPLSETSGGAGAAQTLSGLKGKVVFLNFWATWCGPCRAEMPSMEALYKRYREKGFEILAVNCRENPPEVAAFMRDNGLSFPAAMDIDGQVSGTYGIQAIPTTFILDRGGKIALRVVGSLNWDTPEIRDALERLLDEP